MTRVPAAAGIGALAALAAQLSPTAGIASATPTAVVIAEQEALFARTVEEQGVRAGFLAFLAETAVVFNPEPVPARHSYESKPEDGARLRWHPDLAAISADGDFGWDSGPWLYFKPGALAQADAAGHYFTVWRRANGSWKVLLDVSVSYPTVVADRPQHLDVNTRLRPTATPRSVTSECDEALAGRWRDRGREAALKDFGADDLRLLQFGQPPRDGLREARAADNLRSSALRSLRIARRLAAPRGDVSVSYGEYELFAEGAGAARRALFIAVWDSGKRCRLALEVTQPIE